MCLAGVGRSAGGSKILGLPLLILTSITALADASALAAAVPARDSPLAHPSGRAKSKDSGDGVPP